MEELRPASVSIRRLFGWCRQTASAGGTADDTGSSGRFDSSPPPPGSPPSDCITLHLSGSLQMSLLMAQRGRKTRHAGH